MEYLYTSESEVDFHLNTIISQVRKEEPRAGGRQKAVSSWMELLPEIPFKMNKRLVTILFNIVTIQNCHHFSLWRWREKYEVRVNNMGRGYYGI